MQNILNGILVIFILIMGSSIASANKKTYTNASDFDYPPFVYVNKHGKIDGFDVMALNWIAKKMGFTIKHKEISWAGTIPALLDKKIDMISGGMSITPDRQKLVTFSEPYWQSHKVYLIKSNSSLDANTIQNTKVRLGVKRGTTNADTAQEDIHAKGYAYSLRFYHSTNLAIKDLLLGRIDAVAIDSGPAEDAIAKEKPIKIIDNHGTADVFGIAMRHQDKELHTIINEGYKHLMADPYWKELQKKFFKQE